LTKERAVLAAYTPRDALWTIVVFFLWVGFIGAGIWLLIRLFRNTNFLTEHRALRIVVKVLLVVFTVFIPLLGLPVLFVLWYSTRSRGAELSATDELVEAPGSTPPSRDEAPYHRPLPFPPRSGSVVSDSEREATESPPPFE
jgi:hypothetical protein